MQCCQEANEPAHVFLKKPRQIIKQCEYNSIVEETNLVDLFIFEMHLKSTPKSLVKEGKDLTIVLALDIAETGEAINKQMEAIHIPLEKANEDAIQTNHDCEYVQILW